MLEIWGETNMTILMGKIEYTYEGIDNVDVIYRKLIGEIFAEDIIDSYNYLIKENKITNNCVGILTDTREANFQFSIRKFSRVIHFFKKTKEIKKLRLAVLVNTPDKTIFPLLVARKLPFIKIQPFSTIESAYHWLLQS